MPPSMVNVARNASCFIATQLPTWSWPYGMTPSLPVPEATTWCSPPGASLGTVTSVATDPSGPAVRVASRIGSECSSTRTLDPGRNPLAEKDSLPPGRMMPWLSVAPSPVTGAGRVVVVVGTPPGPGRGVVGAAGETPPGAPGAVGVEPPATAVDVVESQPVSHTDVPTVPSPAV